MTIVISAALGIDPVERRCVLTNSRQQPARRVGLVYAAVRRRGLELAAELLDLVTELRRILEAQLLGGGEHLLLELDDQLLHLVRAAMPSSSASPRRRRAGTVRLFEARNSAMSDMPCSSSPA